MLREPDSFGEPERPSRKRRLVEPNTSKLGLASFGFFGGAIARIAQRNVSELASFGFFRWARDHGNCALAAFLNWLRLVFSGGDSPGYAQRFGIGFVWFSWRSTFARIALRNQERRSVEMFRGRSIVAASRFNHDRSYKIPGARRGFTTINIAIPGRGVLEIEPRREDHDAISRSSQGVGRRLRTGTN